MRAGRKPKPTILRLVAGNPGKRPINANEPIAPKGIPDCPEGLLDGEARKEWERILPQLQGMGLLSPVDRAAIVAYCLIWADFVDSTENIRKFGKVIKAPSGYAIPNPYVSIARQAREDLRKYASEFGLTPSSRTRLHASPAKDVDPMEDFLKGPIKKQPESETDSPKEPVVN